MKIPYRAPIDWSKYGVYGGTVVGLVALLRFIKPLLKSRWTWAIGTVYTVLTMTGGYMFVRIRGMPYSDGGNWIAAGYQNQYGQETQVIAMTCEFRRVCQCLHVVQLCARRWPSRRRFPHAYDGDSISNFTQTTTSADMALEHRDFRHVLRPNLSIPR